MTVRTCTHKTSFKNVVRASRAKRAIALLVLWCSFDTVKAQFHDECWLRQKSEYKVDFYGDNPTSDALQAEMRKLANTAVQIRSTWGDRGTTTYYVPLEIIAAICQKESGGYQFSPNDRFVVHNSQIVSASDIGECRRAYRTNFINEAGTLVPPPGLGLMQMTSRTAIDLSAAEGHSREDLISQWQWNLKAGVKLIAQKYDDAIKDDPSSLVTARRQPQNVAVLENWYYAIGYYNGDVAIDPYKFQSAPSPYISAVYGNIGDSPSTNRASGFLKRIPEGLTTPNIIPGFTNRHGFCAKPDGTWILDSGATSIGKVHTTDSSGVTLTTITKANGVVVPNAVINVDSNPIGSTDSNGKCYQPPWLCGSHLVESVLGKLHFSGVLNFICGSSSAITDRLAEVATANDANTTIEMDSDGSCDATSPINSFAAGDVVEVFGTGNGLRARYPDPCNDAWKVMPDGSRGTILGPSQCCNGYVRWRIRYDDMPSLEMWSAEREPSTGQVFLREVSGGTGPVAPSNLAARAVSTSQINLTWSDQSTNETSFTLERATASGGPWSTATSTMASVQAYSDTGRAAGTTYYYRVRAVNAAGSSAYSNTANATTQQPNATAVLTVTSSNPSSGVSVSTFIGSSSYQSAVTPTSRSFASGTVAGVTCPQTLAGGKYFQKWQLDGVDFAFGTYTTVTMDAGHTLTAVYGTSPPSNRTLTNLVVEGQSSINENSSTQYQARATYSDGSSAYVATVWGEDSAYATISANGVLDVGEVTSDRAMHVIATYASGGTSITYSKDVTIRNTNTASNYSLNLSAQNGYIFVSPDLGSYSAGTQVYLHAHPNSGYVFDHWSGSVSGSDPTIYLTMNGNKSVTANFVVDTSKGSLTVDIQPAQARSEGAQWNTNYYPSYQNGGDTISGITPHHDTIHFKNISGWVTPDDIIIDIIGGQALNFTGVYREILGSVQVTITPPEAVTAGARWRLDGGPWQESTVTIQNVTPGNHSIEFSAVAGWGTPASQTASVARGVTFASHGDYGPPAGLPIITAVSPRTGPISGGTVVTIDGTNFQPGIAVTFGGVAASSVTFLSPTRVSVVTPPRASYGTVALALTSGGQTVTQANGFSYLNSLGSNMDLIGQIGGNIDAIAISGNLVFYGRGTALVVSDFANPASPVERGRIALPALVRDIAVANNIAFVAASAAGVYAVDVSNPSAPLILGFFDTEGEANGVTTLGNIAYVADGSTGLQMLDITNATAITRLGVVDTAGSTARVVAGTIGARRYAFVAERDLALRVIDVTSPANAVEIANIPADGPAGITDVRLVGNTLYVSDWQFGVKIFDVTNPNAPVQTGSRTNVGGGAEIDVANNRLYTCAGLIRVADLAVKPNPTELGYFDTGASFSSRLVVANNLAFACMGRDGLKVINVANPASMSMRSTVETLGSVEDVWVTGGVAYVGNNGGFHTIDVFNPTRPVRLASILPSQRITDIVVADGKATLVNYGDKNVQIVSVTNPSAPAVVGTYTTDEAWNVALMGTTPVLAAATADTAHRPKMDVLNLSSPSNPQSTGSVLLDSGNGLANAIDVVGNWAFVGRYYSALDIVNLANPASPQKVSSISIPDFFTDVAATQDGNYVYVPITTGIQVVDVTNKTAPVLGQLINPPQTPASNTQSLQVVGNRLFAFEGGFLFVFDISNPASPQVVGYYDVPGTGYGISVAGDLVYVAGYNAGVSVLRLNDVEKPTIAITSPTTNTSYATSNSSVSLGGSASDDKGVTRVSWENNRGGGGVASGTTSWQTSAIQLTAGINVITVTAEDANGNVAKDTLSVTANLPDTTPPAVVITGPKPDAYYAVESSNIILSGTAADGTAVTSVSWSNDRGGSGTAGGTTTWTVNLTLLEGPNVITVTATDAAGNQGSTSQVITFATADAMPPTITIDFPTIDPVYETEQTSLNLSGFASDDRGLAEIKWENDRGGSGAVQGATTWWVNDIQLQSGDNVVTVTAKDVAGNVATDTLVVNRITPAIPTPTPTPTATPTATPTPFSPGQLGNISTRLQVGTGNNVLFAGFIIQGNASKTLLIRSAGPSLTQFGVPGALGNPQLELHDANNTIGTNDNWQTTQIGGVITSDQAAAIQNSGAAPLNPAEPAIIATLPAGGYTAIVQGVGGTQGVATVEVYDLSQNNGAILANISTRGFIQTGDNVMIGGFIVVGNSSKVLIRATGPSLIPFGINNALANPRLELHDGNGTLAANDDWQTTQIGGIIASDQSAAIQNSGLAPSNAAESAIIATLAPGNYTAIAQGVNGGTGVGLIEVFALP